MATCPNNALAVYFHGFYAVLYTDSGSLVSWLNFTGPESTSAAEYELHNAVAPDKKGSIFAKEGQIALVMFLDKKATDNPTTLFLRLYYIQKGIADGYPDGSVREVNASIATNKLANTKVLHWSRGDIKTGAPTPSAFDLKKYKAAAGSPLAAVSDGPTIRVYFRKEGSNDMTVAYTDNNPSGGKFTTATLVWTDRAARLATDGF